MLGLTCRIDRSKAVEDRLDDEVGRGLLLPGRTVDDAGDGSRHGWERFALIQKSRRDWRWLAS